MVCVSPNYGVSIATFSRPIHMISFGALPAYTHPAGCDPVALILTQRNVASFELFASGVNVSSLVREPILELSFGRECIFAPLITLQLASATNGTAVGGMAVGAAVGVSVGRIAVGAAVGAAVGGMEVGASVGGTFVGVSVVGSCAATVDDGWPAAVVVVMLIC